MFWHLLGSHNLSENPVFKIKSPFNIKLFCFSRQQLTILNLSSNTFLTPQSRPDDKEEKIAVK